MTGAKLPLFAAGNEAVGVIAFGNLATGVIAVGNLARGFIAIGNVAVGVVAIGNCGFGVVGVGASAAGGLVAYASAVAFPVVEGGALANHDAVGSWALGALMSIAMVVVPSLAMRGGHHPKKSHRLPPIVPLADLAEGRAPGGWVQARFGGYEGERLRLIVEGREQLVFVEGPVERLRGATLLVEGGDVLAQLRVVERPVADQRGGYREGVKREIVLRCDALRGVPSPAQALASKDRILFYLALVWRAAGVFGLAWVALRLARLVS
jgi:hypothetical protein